jgi:hypothetical protein
MFFTTSSGNYQNNGISNAVMGSPFKPNTMAQGSMFSNALHSYANNSGGLKKQKSWGHGAEEHTMYKKIQAIGQSTSKAGLQPDSSLSYKSTDSTIRNSAVARCRAGGCTAPKKKGVNKTQ